MAKKIPYSLTTPPITGVDLRRMGKDPILKKWPVAVVVVPAERRGWHVAGVTIFVEQPGLGSARGEAVVTRTELKRFGPIHSRDSGQPKRYATLDKLVDDVMKAMAPRSLELQFEIGEEPKKKPASKRRKKR